MKDARDSTPYLTVVLTWEGREAAPVPVMAYAAFCFPVARENSQALMRLGSSLGFVNF